MLHWYRLAKDWVKPHRKEGATDHFTAMHGPSPLHGLSPSQRARLFLLGGIETLPLALGVGLAGHLEPTIPYFGSVSIALIVSVLACWLLRHHVPPTVIHAVSTGADTSSRKRALR